MLHHREMKPLTLLYLVLGVTSSCTPPDTSLPATSYAAVTAHSAGDDRSSYLYLGGLFGVHDSGTLANSCGAVRARGLQNLEAFLWAIRSFKTRYPSALGGVNVGALAFDSCSDNFHLLQQYANFHQCLLGYGSPAVNPASVLAYVGPERSTEAVELATYVRRNGPPMVSHAATSSVLSDKTSYPFFLRTVPSDVEQVKAIVEILLTKDWKYVQLVYSGNTFGETGRDAFVAAAQNQGICVVNAQRLSLDGVEEEREAVIGSINDNLYTRAVVVFANPDIANALLRSAVGKNTKGRFTWIGTTSWATSDLWTDGVEDVALGAVTVALEPQVPQNFIDYFRNLQPGQNNDNPWFTEYWSDTFQCYFADIPNPNGYGQLCDDISASLDVELDPFVGYTIQAVDIVLLAIDEVRKTECTLSSDGLCDEFYDGDKWKVVHENILKLKRDAVNVFDQNSGDPLSASYKIYNYRTCQTRGHCYELIGSYNTRPSELQLEPTELHTYDLLGERVYGSTSTCSQTPCSVCGEKAENITTTPMVSAPGVSGTGAASAEPSVTLRTESWVIPLLVLASVGVLLVVIFDFFLLCKIYRSSYLKHWRTMWLGQVLLVGILLCYLTLYAFIPTPTTATCGIIRFGVGVSYAMCFSVLLVKLLIVLNSEEDGDLKGAFQFLMFFFAWGVQVAVDTELLVIRRPGTTLSSPADPTSGVCTHGDFTTHVQSLVYVMFLIFLCTVLSIRTHKIVTNHREGIFIGICAGFTIPIWLVWILLGILSSDSSYHDPCLAFGLFATATLLLFVMYLPKVRQLNSMGVEGIYAEDDTPDFTPNVVQPSLIPAAPPSVIGYAPTKVPSEGGSLVLIPNGEFAKHPMEVKQPAGPYALHVRYPGPRHYHRHHMNNIETASVQSAPLGPTYMVRRTRPAPPPAVTTTAAIPERENIQGTTRVLRMTTDLTGRPQVAVPDGRADSDANVNVTYGPPKSDANKSSGQNGIEKTVLNTTTADVES